LNTVKFNLAGGVVLSTSCKDSVVQRQEVCRQQHVAMLTAWITDSQSVLPHPASCQTLNLTSSPLRPQLTLYCFSRQYRPTCI